MLLRYQTDTISSPWCELFIGSNMGVLKMTREHLGIIKALNIPFFVVLTKLDICPKNVLERTQNEITRLIKRNFKKDSIYRWNPTNRDFFIYGRNFKREKMMNIC